MGQSPHKFPRTVSLEEAFRRILRAIYSERPALADEVKSFWWKDRKRLPDEDVAVNKAHELFEERVARGKIRLRGVLDLRKPREDIDPADAKNGKLDIFAGELRVFLNNKVVRTYRQVHCYEADLRSRTRPSAAPRAKPTSEADLAIFTRNYLDNGGRPVERPFAIAARNAGINATRKRLRAALPARPRGRPIKSPKK
jgi:hypothetical protein